MRITWFGHAAFLLESGSHRIIMDPYSSACGYAPIHEAADIVTISHVNEKYHSHTGDIKGHFELINGLELPPSGRTVHDIHFQGTTVYEDARGGGDPNAMITFEIEGIKIAHLGDLGHPLNAAQRHALDGTDILLALAGGHPTIALPDLYELWRDLKPPVLIPMHFKTPKIDLRIRPVEDFLQLCPADSILYTDAMTWEINHDSLPTKPTIVVLPYIR